MNTEGVVSDILGADLKSDWNASDEEDCVEDKASFHVLKDVQCCICT